MDKKTRKRCLLWIKKQGRGVCCGLKKNKEEVFAVDKKQGRGVCYG